MRAALSVGSWEPAEQAWKGLIGGWMAVCSWLGSYWLCWAPGEELGRLHATQEAQSVAVLVHVRVVVFVRCIYVRCVREQGHC